MCVYVCECLCVCVCELAVLNVSDENTRIFVLPALAFRCILCSLDVYPHTEQNSRAGRSLEIATAVLTAFSRAAFWGLFFRFQFYFDTRSDSPRLQFSACFNESSRASRAPASYSAFLSRHRHRRELRAFIQILCNRCSKKKHKLQSFAIYIPFIVFNPQLAYSCRSIKKYVR